MSDNPHRRASDSDAATEATLGEVHAGIVAVADSMAALAEAITDNTKTASRAHSIWLGLLTLGVAFLSIIAILTYSQSQENHGEATLIADCTNPTGACYQRQLAREAVLIERVKADGVADAERVVHQLECDLGFVCAEGFTPTARPPG